MKKLSLMVLLLAALPGRGADLPRNSPESQGVDSAAIAAFVETANKKIDSLHSLMIVSHGQVISEGWWAPYDAKTPHSLYSLSKSFTSTGVGMAIAEGKLSLDDEVLKFFPEDAPANPSANLKAMRVSDLLRMNTGHQTEPPRTPGKTWAANFLAHPVPFKPGTHFLYNTPATYMLSAIVQKATGQTLVDYLKPRLFEPLGIEGATWEKSPEGISVGGYGLSVRTEDIAKFGQLYLQKGKWNGKQLVPESWVEMATARQTSNGSNPKSDWDQGYGYQFWRCRNGAYRGDGAFGQYCVVLPEQDTVIAITSGLGNMQAVLDLVWGTLAPGLKDKPLPINKEANLTLGLTLMNLSLPKPISKGAEGTTFVGKTFEFPANGRKFESMKLEDGGSGQQMILVARINGAEQRISCGKGEWIKSKASWGGFPEQAIGATAAWTDADTLTTKIAFRETPFVMTVRLKFSGDQVTYEAESNVGFGPAKQEPLKGKAK